MSEIAIKERVELTPVVPIDGAVVRTDDLAIAKLTTIQQRALAARGLQKVEANVEVLHIQHRLDDQARQHEQRQGERDL